MSTTTRQEHVAHSTAAMTNVSATILAANNNRRYALIQNDGSVDVYIRLGTPAVANQGIRVTANGGTYLMGEVYGALYVGVITGITAAGTATMLVTEAT